MKEKIQVSVFSKPALPGQVKTRLSPSVSPRDAARLAEAFFEDTWDGVSSLSWADPVAVVAAPFEKFNALSKVRADLQEGEDLGERLEAALKKSLETHPAAIVIGSDSPGLPSLFFEAAREALKSFDAVLGPAEDGGFYLLGLKKCPPGLLKNLPWSQSDTFSRTLDRLTSLGLSVSVLDDWFDVDKPKDLRRLSQLIDQKKVFAPHTNKVLHSMRTISVIIPTLNEERCIGKRLEELFSDHAFREVIVVDGGSQDRTCEIVQAHGAARLLSAQPGRASQMNVGAAQAVGDILLFLHADVALPKAAAALVLEALALPDRVAGAFRVRTKSEGAPFWLSLFFPIADLRSRYSSLPYGDQALFLQKSTFDRLGGFPSQPLMEDLELSRRLTRVGKIEVVRQCVEVSARRIVARPLYHLFAFNFFPILYRLGVPASKLASMYRHQR